MTSHEPSAYNIDQQLAELELFTVLAEGADQYYTKLADENPLLGESVEAFAVVAVEVITEMDEAFADHAKLLKRGFKGLFLITSRFNDEAQEFEFPTADTLVDVLHYMRLLFGGDIGRTAHEFSLFALMAQAIKEDDEYLFGVPDARLGLLFSVISRNGFSRGILGLDGLSEA